MQSQTMHFSKTASPAANLSVFMDLDNVEIRLKGAFLVEQYPSLQLLLQQLIKHNPARRWVVRVDHVDMISGRCLLLLKKFARRIGKHGAQVEIAGMQPYFRAMVYDLNLQKYFQPAASKAVELIH